MPAEVQGIEAPEAAYEALRQRFAAGLPGRWAEIAGTEGAARVAALHRLAGAAGAYGFESVGAAAREAEQAAEVGDARAAATALAGLARALADAGVTV